MRYFLACVSISPMLMIRLQRVGRKNIPTFRIVLTESQNSTKSGKYLEVLGNYDAVHNVKEIKEDRVKYWMSKGAQLSDTLNNFMIEKGMIVGQKRNVLSHRKPVAKTEKKPEGEKKGAVTAQTGAPSSTPSEAPKEAEAVATSAEAPNV